MRTRVVYAGGTKKNPTYYNLGDHTETIQIDYDPTKTSYKQLLELFWQVHNPCAQPGKRQYMSAIFYANDDQKKLAIETRDSEAVKQKRKVTTEILPLGDVYLAEDYHQKYYLRQVETIEAHYKKIYPKLEDFINSTAIARLNSYISGHGKYEQLVQEIDSYGLPENLKKQLLQAAKNNQ